MINLNLDWEILTCILLWRQNQEILVLIKISQLLRPTFCNCWDFLGCWDLLLPSVEIETLDQDHDQKFWLPNILGISKLIATRCPFPKLFFQRVDYKIRVAIIGPKLKKLNSVESTKKEPCSMEIQTFQVSFLKSWAIYSFNLLMLINNASNCTVSNRNINLHILTKP